MATATRNMTGIVTRNVGGQANVNEIHINGTKYLCRCEPTYFELVKSASADLDEPITYHIPSDYTSCDCADCTYRCRECKHIRAVKALRQAGKL